MANIFAQYLKPPKTVLEYGADLDAAEANRLTLAEARRKGVAAEQDMAEQNAFKRALAGGLDLSTPEGLRTGLATSPRHALDAAKKVGDIRKSEQEAKTSKTRGDLYAAQEFKTKLETDMKARDDAILHVTAMKSPEEVLAALNQRVTDGQLKPEQAVAIAHSLPRPGSPPEQYAAWLDKTVKGIKTLQQRDLETHNRLTRWLTERGQNMAQGNQDANRVAQAPLREAQTKYYNNQANLNSPAAPPIPGMPPNAAPAPNAATSQPLPAVAPGGAATTWNGTPLRTEADARVAIGAIPQGPAVPAGADPAQVLLDQQTRAVPVDRELARLPQPVNPIPAASGPVAQPGAAAPAQFDPSKYPPLPGETRAKYAERLGNFQRDFEKHQLSGATQDVENIAQALADGRMAPPTGASLRNPQVMAAMTRALQINPQLNSQDFQAKSKAVRDFATGRQGDTVRSFNVATAHLGTLEEVAAALGNNDIRAFNYVANRYAMETGNPAPTDFEAVKRIVGNEIVKAIVGSGSGALGDREEAAKTIASYNSPEQLRSAIRQYKELMAGQLGGLRRQYEISTGRKDFDRMLDDSVQRSTTMPRAQAGNAPAIGERRTINGVPAEWDGKGWKRVP